MIGIPEGTRVQPRSLFTPFIDVYASENNHQNTLLTCAGKSGTLINLAPDAYLTPHRSHQLLANNEAQTGPTKPGKVRM